MNLTETEKKMLENIARSHYSESNGGEWKAYDYVWADCLDQHPHPFKTTSVGGLVGSLVKKGLVESDGLKPAEACVCLTHTGVEIYNNMEKFDD